MKKDFTTKKTALFFIACLLIAALASAATYLGRDYAKETIQPIEATLLAEGAKKLCESGSSGKGPDNKEPLVWRVLHCPETTKRNRSFSA